MKRAALLLAVMLTACVTPPIPPAGWCGLQCEQELHAARAAAYVNSATLYGGTSAQVRADDALKIKEIRQHKIDLKGEQLVTTRGVNLEKYGTVGKSAYSQVQQCRLDVAQTIKDVTLREKYAADCYELLPAQLQARFKALDESVPAITPVIILK